MFRPVAAMFIVGIGIEKHSNHPEIVVEKPPALYGQAVVTVRMIGVLRLWSCPLISLRTGIPAHISIAKLTLAAKELTGLFERLIFI